MLTYEMMYKKYGINKIKHFINPRIMDSSDFVYPKRSLLYFFKVSDVPYYLTTDDSVINSNKKNVVFTVTDYFKNTLGKFHPSNIKPNSLISQLQKKEKSFKFLKPTQTKFKLTDSHMFIVNYSGLNSLNKYSMHPLNNYYKWYNVLSTFVDNYNNNFIANNRKSFLNFDLPTALPPFMKLEKYANTGLSKILLDKLPNYKYLNILDLWKLLTPELKNDSILGKIEIDKIKDLDLLLTIDNKIVILNLGKLLSMVKEYNLESNLPKYGAKTVRKIIYVFLTKTIISKPLTLSEIENDEIETKGMSKLLDNIDEINIDENINIDDELTNVEYARDKLLSDEPDDNKDGIVEEDELLEELSNFEIKENTTDIELPIETIDDVKQLKKDGLANNVKQIENLLANKLITKNTYNKLMKLIDKQVNDVSSYAGDKLSEVLDTSKDDLVIKDEEKEIPDTPAVLDKSYNANTTNILTKKYLKELYKKDIVRSFYALQDHGMIIEEHDVTTEDSILGGTETHNIKLTTIDGKSVNIKIILPVISEDGTFKLSGNTYLARKQKADLPIKKIDFNSVTLSTAYGVKIFITKATYKKDDAGYWLQKYLLKRYDEDEKLKDLVLFSVNKSGLNLPNDYTLFSRYIKSFTYDKINYYFEYKTRSNILDKKYKLKDIEKNKYVYVGNYVNGKELLPVVMDKNNNLYKYLNGKYEEVGDVLNNIGVDRNIMPVEYANMRLFKFQIPVGIILSYYFKFSKLLKMFKTKYTTYDSNVRVKLESNQYKITFEDKTYVIDRDYGMSDMVIYGITKINTILKNYNHNVLNDKNTFNVILSAMGLSLLYFNELKLLEDMFVDPVSKEILENMNEPVTIYGLLVRSVELLLDDNYKNPNDVTTTRARGYDRVSYMLYSELVSAIRQNDNKSFFGKSKLTIDPYSVLNKISSDNTTVIQDDLNPIATLKQTEDVTFFGEGGRSKETIAAKDRELDPSEIGLYSESSKDSGDVGTNSYFSANPSIVDVRGLAKEKSNEELEWGNIMSTSALLAPFSTGDDVKRSNFIGIQSAHVVPMNEMRAPYVRTGYETVIANRLSDKFAIQAEDDGKVISVKGNTIVVKYKTLGEKKYKLKTWTTKEESGSCYTHVVVPNVKNNESIKKGDIIGYDKLFFEPDIFDPKRVIYKQGTTIRVAFKEDDETYEDSAAISNKLSHRLGTKVNKTKSFVINAKDDILDMLNIGSEVKPTDNLFTIADASLAMMGNLDEKTREILQGIKSSSPKAKVKGRISNIIIYYNLEDIEEASKTIQDLIKASDARLKKNTGYTGKVNSSYSIEGKPLLPGEIEIKIYIDVSVSMGIGDKAIFANQLKFTVGEAYNYSITTEDGEDVEALFSTRSLSARIVVSPFLIGTTSTVLEYVEKRALDMYFN